MKHPAVFLVIALLLASQPLQGTQDNCLQQARTAIDRKQLPQAQTLLQDHLQHSPGDEEARFTLARVLSWQQRYTEALQQFDSLISHRPDNSDYLLARARVHEWMGNDDLALADLQTARTTTPDYAEVWQQQIKLLARNDNQAFSTLLQQAQKRYPEIEWQQWQAPKTPISTRSARYQLETRLGYDALDNNRRDWKQAGVTLNGRTEKGGGNVRLDVFERFGLRDWQFAGGFYLPLNDDWSLATSASLSPTANVIARNRIESVISKHFTHGYNLHAGVQFANFAATDSRHLQLTGEYYWSRFRAAYTYRLIDVTNAGTGNNHRFVINHEYGHSSMFALSLSTGKDVEYDGTVSPPVSDVRIVSLYGRHNIGDDVTINWSVFKHQQGTFYTRNGLVIGIQFDL